ncbi:hypothetical protein GCM10023317_33080 [Actinopolymorpha pittospori]
MMPGATRSTAKRTRGVRSASALDRMLPAPRMDEVDTVDLTMSPEEAWDVIRHGDLFENSRLARGLSALRAMPDRIAHREVEGGPSGRIDDLSSRPEAPGFRVLAEDAPREVVVGAIGKVWRARVAFIEVPSASAFTDFDQAGFVKAAWAIRLTDLGEGVTRVTLEVRADATDPATWRRFRRYLHLFGPGSRLLRRRLMAGLARGHGTPDQHPLARSAFRRRSRPGAVGEGGRRPEAETGEAGVGEAGVAEPVQPARRTGPIARPRRSPEAARAVPGDDLLPDATTQVTQEVTIQARPETIWPWLVQMGSGRAGFYSLDSVDNAGRRSARELRPEFQDLRRGDIISAAPAGRGGFEVLDIQPDRSLVLGNLVDRMSGTQIPFSDERPSRFWQTTWVFLLEPEEAGTRLTVRSRASFSEGGRLHAGWRLPVQRGLQNVQLRHLAARAEGRLRRDDWRDVVAGVGGAALMAAAVATPFLRGRRSTWGLDDPVEAERAYPGDGLVPEPRWGYTHAIEVDAPVEAVWPWVEQVGADRAGFYSYQWLENLAGAQVRNAETVHPEWSAAEGAEVLVHPRVVPLRIVEVAPGRSFVAYVDDEKARDQGQPWARASWHLAVEPIDAHHTRFLSRYRTDFSADLRTRLEFGPVLGEPVSFVMDRQMLQGVKERAEERGVGLSVPCPRRGGASSDPT